MIKVFYFKNPPVIILMQCHTPILWEVLEPLDPVKPLSQPFLKVITTH